MAKQTALELKRKEAREEILAMKESILITKIVNFLGRAFKSQSFGYWLSNFIALSVIALAPWLLVGLALDELVPNQYLWIPGLMVTEMIILGFMLTQIVTLRIFDDIANQIIQKINNADDVLKQVQWIQTSWSTPTVLRFVFILAAIWVAWGMGGVSIAYQNFVGFGFLLCGIFVGLLAGLIFYVVFWLGLFASNLQNYQYELNAFSPIDSELIEDVSEILTKRIYIVAAYLAVASLMASSNLIDKQITMIFSVPLLFGSWIVIIAQFYLIQASLGKIIKNAKWKTLNKIQAKINSVESTGDLSDKETAEKLLRLADIHKQITTSKTNTFDLKSLTTLFSQLMLPLLGLLLGNLDNILELLQK